MKRTCTFRERERAMHRHIERYMDRSMDRWIASDAHVQEWKRLSIPELASVRPSNGNNQTQ